MLKNYNSQHILCLENGIRFLKMDSSFFTGYRKNSIHPDEVLIDLFIPFLQKVRL